MTGVIFHTLAQQFVKSRPEIRPGYTVRVFERIVEGDKERVQIFEGLVIAMHNGHCPADRTITVRRIVSGVGVEKIFSVHSPKIEKIEVKKVAAVRRAKLFFLRGRAGKSARLSERFTNAGEFEAIAVPAMEEDEAPMMEEEVAAEEVATEAAPTEDVAAEAPAEEEKKEEAPQA